MKNFLLILLAIVMLTPALACASHACVNMQEPAQSQEMPCHKTGDTDSGKQQPCDMFMKDCAKTDLMTGGDVPLLKKPDTDGKTYALTVPDVPGDAVTMIEAHAIRGPPGWISARYSTTPPVIHTTQRVRE